MQIVKQNKEKTCLDCGKEVEGKHVRCPGCSKRAKIQQTVNSNEGNKKESKKSLRSLNGKIPVKNNILGYLMSAGQSAGY